MEQSSITASSSAVYFGNSWHCSSLDSSQTFPLFNCLHCFRDTRRLVFILDFRPMLYLHPLFLRSLLSRIDSINSSWNVSPFCFSSTLQLELKSKSYRWRQCYVHRGQVGSLPLHPSFDRTCESGAVKLFSVTYIHGRKVSSVRSTFKTSAP